MSTTKSVLFVCLGNICRSPIAEAVFLNLIKEKGVESEWKVDSAAIGPWHVGKRPDKRALATLTKHNIQYNGKCRQLQKSDFHEFDFIFGMDESNISDLEGAKPSRSDAKVLLLGDFDPEGERIIKDPYYDSGLEGFEKCYEQCVRSCTAFLENADRLKNEDYFD